MPRHTRGMPLPHRQRNGRSLFSGSNNSNQMASDDSPPHVRYTYDASTSHTSRAHSGMASSASAWEDLDLARATTGQIPIRTTATCPLVARHGIIWDMVIVRALSNSNEA